MRIILAAAAALFGFGGIVALFDIRSDIQIILEVQGLGFALMFAAAFAILGSLRRIANAAQALANSTPSGLTTVENAPPITDGARTAGKSNLVQ